MANTERMKLEDVAEALRLGSGIVARARQILESKYPGIAYNTVKGYLERHPELRAVQQEAEEQMLDAAEAKAHKLILKDEDSSMIRYYLSTKGRHRGWGKTIEATGPGGGPLQVGFSVAELEKNLERLDAIERANLRAILNKLAVDDEAS